MIERKDTEEGRRVERMAEQAVRDRLDDLIRRSGEDYASLSRRLGRNPAYIQQYIKRGVPRRLNEVDRRTLARYFNVPESFLGAPEPSDPPAPAGQADRAAALGLLREARVIPAKAAVAAANEPPPGSEAAPPADGFLLVPFLDNRPEPRAGSEAAGARCLAFALATARQMAAGRLSALRALRIDSDSMLPTLAAGDEVLIDCDDGQRLRDGIFVIRSEGALLVKRLSVHPVTKRLSVISDNPAYPSFADCDPGLVQVIGRVVWVSRRLA